MQIVEKQFIKLSKRQERLWQQHGDIKSTQATFMLRGICDLSQFQQSFQWIVERYEILRTAFVTLPNMSFPVQVVHPHREIAYPLVDLSSLDASSQKRQLADCQQELTQRSFNLKEGPLLDVMLFRLAELQHILTLRICALCADIYTIRSLFGEVIQFYTLFRCEGARVFEAEEALQYIDVSSWQEDLLASDDATAQRAIWRSFDPADLVSMRLPLTGSERREYSALDRKSVLTIPPQRLPIILEATEQRRLHDLCLRCKVSLESCLLACWQVLFWHLIDTPPLIGVVCDGRRYEDLALTLGPYARAVPFPLHLDEAMSFEQVLTETFLTKQEVGEKQLYFSWEALASEVPDQEQIFSAAFSFEDWPATWEGGSLEVTLLEQKSWGDPCLLCLQASQIGEQLQLQLVYHPSVFSRERAQYLADLLQTLLHSATASPQALIGQLPLLSDQQQTYQQRRWSGPERAWPFQPLHQLFEEQVRRQPTALAVRSGSLVLSYAQLEQQANQLSHLLLRQGLLPGGRVVLGLPRDHWAIIGLLAVLKAGGTYVPLEMDQPIGRLQNLLHRVEPALILSTQALGSCLQQSTVPVLLIETVAPLLPELPDTPPQVKVNPQDLAYIIFTSGSTGMPKGVMIRHQSVSNYTQALCELLEVQENWHFGTMSSLTADLGNTAIFCGLASGGCVHVFSSEQITDAAFLQDYGQHFPLDILKIVPSHLRALLTAGADAILPRRRLVLGGEALPWSLIELVQQQQPSCYLYNHYGPTEATIGTLVYSLGEARQVYLPPVEQRGSSVPIGHPIANAQVYVLDSQQQWVPDGVTAELYIGGMGVAEGYLHDVKQNKQCFVKVEREGKQYTLYRTGDRVRVGETGALEFIGRQDTQVKLRGYRIELGEIEEQLKQHPAVRQAIVQLRAEEGREAQLVGYIVPWRQPGPGKEEIRQALEEQLPAYMIPAALVSLEQLPLTSSGKVDRQRLPAPTWNEGEREEIRQLESARSPVEEVMVDVWQEVLNQQQVSTTDNFFRLGGHSLLGMQLISRLRVIFGVEVPINRLFEAPTVAQLAARVETLLQGQEYASPPPIGPVPRSQSLPLSFAQQRLWFLDQLEPGNTAYIIPITVEFQGALDLEAFEDSLTRLIERHEGLRTTFQEQEGQPYQIIGPPKKANLMLIDLQALSTERQETVARALNEQETLFAFDLRRGPLLRCWLARLEEHKHWMRLSLHHIVSDGWSRGVLIRELVSLYRTYRTDGAAALAPLPIQYADYAYWQRHWLQGEVLKERLRYWTHQLNGAQALKLPTDYPRTPDFNHRGANYRFQIDTELSQALRQLSRQEGATLFMLLLATFQVLLCRLSGEQDIVVGTDSANRGYLETEGLIGFFINLLALRTRLGGNPRFLQVLHEVREMVLGAYLHQELPFEMIVEHLHLAREGNRTPLVNVLFVMQNVPRIGAEFSEIVVRPVEQKVNYAKFDLAIFITESSQGLSGSVIYSADLFKEATIEKMLTSYQVLLHDIVARPDAIVNNLEIQSRAERAEGERVEQDRGLARRSKLKKVDRSEIELN